MAEEELPALENPPTPQILTDLTPEQLAERESVQYFTLARAGEFTKLLQEYQANPKILELRDEDNHGFIHWAALFGDNFFLATVLPDGWPVDIRASNRQTPLMWAALRGHIPVIKLLIEYGADVFAEDSLGATPILLAIQYKEIKTFLLLAFQDKKLLNCKDANGCTLTHWASYKGDMDALRLLEYFNLDFAAVDNTGMTALHRAVSASHLPVSDWLIRSKKLDPYVRNSDGENCFDLGKKANNQYIREAMVQSLLKVGIRRRAEDEDVDLQSLEEGAVTLPEVEPSKGMMHDIFKDQSAQILFPAFFITCTALISFCYLTEMREVAHTVVPNLCLLMEILLPTSVVMFFACIKSDPGKIPRRVIGNSAVEDTMAALAGEMDIQDVDLSRLCTTCWIIKGLRTKHCSECDACVSEFDHHCVWINNCVGGGNHRLFISMAIMVLVTEILHLIVCWKFLQDALPSDTTFFSYLFVALTSFPAICLGMCLDCATIPWICMLSSYQLRLVSQNLSTNEIINMYRYEHFWTMKEGEHGMMKSARNPFDKGGMLRNCMDFWIRRERSERGPQVYSPLQTESEMTVIGHSHGGRPCTHNHG